jgi:hypothetical protein
MTLQQIVMNFIKEHTMAYTDNVCLSKQRTVFDRYK